MAENKEITTTKKNYDTFPKINQMPGSGLKRQWSVAFGCHLPVTWRRSFRGSAS